MILAYDNVREKNSAILCWTLDLQVYNDKWVLFSATNFVVNYYESIRN